jgi:cytochrome c-type biogenesis protein CcsB
MESLAYYAFLSGFFVACVAAAAYIVTAIGAWTAYRPAATNAGTLSIPVTVTLPGGADRVARLSLYVALAFLTLSIVSRAIAVGRPPVGNLWEYTVALSWGIVLFTAVFEASFKERSIPAVMLPGAVAMMGVALLFFPSEIKPLVPALQSNRILGLHVTTMMLAYSALSISFGASILYLVQTSGPSPATAPREPSSAGSGVSPASNVNRRHSRLPDAESLGEVAYWSVLVGFPLLTLGIALGAYWANNAWGRYWGWDPKETSALLTWFVYAGYLHARGLRGWEGKRAAYLLLVGYAAVLFTYFAVNFLISGLHSYAGV